jgi:hypothetical protein
MFLSIALLQSSSKSILVRFTYKRLLIKSWEPSTGFIGAILITWSRFRSIRIHGSRFSGHKSIYIRVEIFKAN